LRNNGTHLSIKKKSILIPEKKEATNRGYRMLLKKKILNLAPHTKENVTIICSSMTIVVIPCITANIISVALINFLC
jgi:hypothetical protein